MGNGNNVWVPLKDVAARIGLPYDTSAQRDAARRFLFPFFQRNSIGCRKVGGRWCVHGAQFDAWIAPRLAALADSD